jgi:hypothetical protein
MSSLTVFRGELGRPRAAEQLLTAKQVAEILQVSPGWVRDHAGRKQPHLKCVHVGDLLRFRPSDVNEFIEQRSDGARAHRKESGSQAR